MRTPKLFLALAVAISMASPAAWSFHGFGNSSWAGNRTATGTTNGNGYASSNPYINGSGGGIGRLLSGAIGQPGANGGGHWGGLNRWRSMAGLGGNRSAYNTSGYGNTGYSPISNSGYAPMYNGGGYNNMGAMNPMASMGYGNPMASMGSINPMSLMGYGNPMASMGSINPMSSMMNNGNNMAYGNGQGQGMMGMMGRHHHHHHRWM